MLAAMTRRETHVGFEATAEMKTRILEIVAESERSMAKVMRKFCELGIKRYDAEGAQMFYPHVTKKRGTDSK